MDLPLPKRCTKKEGDCQCIEMAPPGRRFCKRHNLEVRRPDERQRERKLAIGVEDSVSFEMASHGRRFCRKHSLEVKHPDERKRGRKLAAGEDDSISSGACSKKMRVLSADIGKKKMFGRSKEREGDRMKEDCTQDDLGKREGEGLLLFYEIKKGGSSFDEGKKGVAKRNTEVKKRFFGDKVKESARFNRDSGGPSRAEKSAGVARKKTSPPSKCKDFGGRTAKVESITLYISNAMEDFGVLHLHISY